MRKEPVSKLNLKLQGVAYHEAGHAVVSFHLGQRFKSVTIVADGSSTGRVIAAPLPRTMTRWKFFETQPVIAFAGRIAEMRHTRKRERNAACFADDYFRVTDMLYQHGIDDEDQPRFLERFEARAKKLVGLHWNDISKVAEALLERSTLTYKEVRAIVMSKGE